MIPYATTTLSVLRMPQAALDAEPYNEPSSRTVTSSGIRAHIGNPSGAQRRTGGEQQTLLFRLDCDIADINYQDYLKDEVTGDIYRVDWVRARYGLGLDHMEGGLDMVTGVSG